MLGNQCLVCSCFIEGKAFAWYPPTNGFPICSEVCVLDWNDLSYEEQQRYIQCQHALEALRAE